MIFIVQKILILEILLDILLIVLFVQVDFLVLLLTMF